MLLFVCVRQIARSCFSVKELLKWCSQAYFNDRFVFSSSFTILFEGPIITQKNLSDSQFLVTFIGLVVLAFGPSYSYALIRILYGQKWSDGEAPLALRYYCFYVISLAMNGLFYSFQPS